MFMMYETLMLAFIALIAPLFGKLAGYELRRKPFEFVAASGLFFLLTVAFGILPLQETFLTSIWNFLGVISYFIGWLALFLWSAGISLSTGSGLEGRLERLIIDRATGSILLWISPTCPKCRE